MNSNTLVLFTRFGMGDAPAELQKKLAVIFLTLLNQDALPGIVAFYGEGVKLACDDSPVLDQLHALSEKGARLVICQTCLDFFGLRDKMRVGIVGGMGDIVAAMNGAEKVISV
ncbi:MAG: DsrE family protein [Anaerolineales bacterium]|nr:DsrE family protein [Anaerolineales bacterium]